MELELTPEEKLLRDTAAEFARGEIEPKAAEIDRERRFPHEIVEKLGRMGMMGICVPRELGGAGGDSVAYVLVLEELARACASTGIIVSVNNGMVCEPLLRHGSDRQRATWLPRLASGKWLGCFALSEPDAGSDAAAMKTTAVRRGTEWVLNGTKAFITNAPVSDVMLVFASTDPGRGAKGISAFIVPTDLRGVSFGEADDKLGIRGAASSRIVLDNCAVPAESLLGQANQGWGVAMDTLDFGRLGCAAQAVGIARAAFEDASAYAAERRTFGKLLGEHQEIQFKLADMATEIDAARLLVLHAATLKDSGARYTAEASMAKLFASETANRAAREALQVFGGCGYLTGCPAERHFRDAKVTEIYEGTSEIQRMVIASSLLHD